MLKVLCEKHKLNSEEYTLRMADTKTDLPATKTIGELNISLLCLMKKNAHSGTRNLKANFFFLFSSTNILQLVISSSAPPARARQTTLLVVKDLFPILP